MKHLFNAFSILTLTTLMLGASVSFADDDHPLGDNEDAATEATFQGSTQCTKEGCPKFMTNSPVSERSQYHSNQLADQTLGKSAGSAGGSGSSEAER